MNDSLVFALGLALLLVLGAIVGRLLARDYRSRRGASIVTVAVLWATTGVHFSLVLLAALRSTWHFSLPTPLGLGGGMVLAGVGAAMSLGAVYAFRSFKRLNFLDHTRLVTDGVYRWSRNPQLVGWTLVLAGLGLVRGSGMVLFLALVAWVGYRRHLPIEEEHLRIVFGEAYEVYRSRTHRYFGPQRRHHPARSYGNAAEQRDVAEGTR
jgi:protein-S-isoprenylcysteine O-methyltransferase Ste14